MTLKVEEFDLSSSLSSSDKSWKSGETKEWQEARLIKPWITVSAVFYHDVWSIRQQILILSVINSDVKYPQSRKKGNQIRESCKEKRKDLRLLWPYISLSEGPSRELRKGQQMPEQSFQRILKSGALSSYINFD